MTKKIEAENNAKKNAPVKLVLNYRSAGRPTGSTIAASPVVLQFITILLIFPY